MIKFKIEDSLRQKSNYAQPNAKMGVQQGFYFDRTTLSVTEKNLFSQWCTCNEYIP